MTTTIAHRFIAKRPNEKALYKINILIYILINILLSPVQNKLAETPLGG